MSLLRPIEAAIEEAVEGLAKLNLPRVAVIGGFGGAGKDAAADVLTSQFGYERLAFSKPIETELLRRNPVIGGGERVHELVNRLGFTRAKAEVPGFRDEMVKIGNELRADDPQALVKRLKAEMKRGQRYVLTGPRTEDELAFGDARIWLNRPGIGPANPSEEMLPGLSYTHTIQNRGGMRDLPGAVTEGLGIPRTPFHTQGDLNLFVTHQTKIADLQGINPKAVFSDDSGQRWLFKYGGNQEDLNPTEHAAHALAKTIGYPAAPGSAAKIHEEPGFLQRMFETEHPDLNHLWDRDVGLYRFNREQTSDVMHHMVYSEAIGSYDLHAGNFVSLPGGRIRGVDLGLSFSYLNPLTQLPKDSLDSDVIHSAMAQLTLGQVRDPHAIMQETLNYAQQIQDFPEAPYRAAIGNLTPRRQEQALMRKRNLVDQIQHNFKAFNAPDMTPSSGGSPLPVQSAAFRGTGPADFHMRRGR